ncbi:MAG: hypothetical protein RL026_2231 [Pseudomonadota bacterium]
MSTRAGIGGQRGQAMTEMAIALLALAPLLFAMPWLYRFQAVQRQTISAAREVAYSSAFGGFPQAEVARKAHLRRWHFDDPGAVDPHTGRSLVADEDAINAVVLAGPPPGRAAELQTALVEPLRVVGGFLGADFTLNPAAHHSVVLNVSLSTAAGAPQPFDSIDLELKSQSAVLGDPWGGGDPQRVAARVRGLTPTGFLAEHQQLLRTALWPARLVEPALDHLCLGLVEPDRVPLDRLDPLPGNRPQPGQAGCR